MFHLILIVEKLLKKKIRKHLRSINFNACARQAGIIIISNANEMGLKETVKSVALN